MPTEDHGVHISLQRAINHLSKRYGEYNQHKNNISSSAILGICAAVAGAAIILLFCLKGIKRGRQNNANSYRSGNTLPVVEPNRGRPPPRATRPQQSYPRAAQIIREPTPPPPYVREPEAAHVKNNAEESGLPSYAQ